MREPYEEPLSVGIGCLKTILGVYVLIIVTIFAVAGKHHDVPETNDRQIEVEAEDQYVVLSYGDKVFAMGYDAYQSFLNSNAETTLIVDVLDKNSEPIAISKEDLVELTTCETYDDAVYYITNLKTNDVSFVK